MINKTAKALLKQKLHVIPVTKDKNPAVSRLRDEAYKPEEVEQVFKGADGIAIRTGGETKITVLDFDIKYDLTGTLYERYKAEVPPELFSKMKVQETRNKGFHWVFKCDKIEPNQGLAHRETTEQELLTTWAENYIKSNGDFRVTLNATFNDRVRVLIETRGGRDNSFGGYFLTAPSPGYSWLNKVQLQEITVEEYDQLLEIARSFTEVYKPSTKRSVVTIGGSSSDSVFHRFNLEADGVQLLVDNGWTIKRDDGAKVRMLRPGFCTSQDSGIYNRDGDAGTFVCFSTSTVFPALEGLNNCSILMHLENLDTNGLYLRLKEMGYG